MCISRNRPLVLRKARCTFEAVLKQTLEECSDKQGIPILVALIREFLAEVNLQRGRAESRFNFLQLEQRLLFQVTSGVLRFTDIKRLSRTYPSRLGYTKAA
jgi:hypothetical protein